MFCTFSCIKIVYTEQGCERFGVLEKNKDMFSFYTYILLIHKFIYKTMFYSVNVQFVLTESLISFKN